MSSHIFWVLVLFTIFNNPSLGDDYTDVFEFGANKGKVSFSTSGSIGIWPADKVTVIPIKIPECTRITYVRVEVHNIVAPPYVKFDDSLNAVIIKYRLLQYSRSKYVIIAKTKKSDCGEDGGEKKKDNDDEKKKKKKKKGDKKKKKKKSKKVEEEPEEELEN